jgi:AraC family transcriptional regulator of adaptative response / DNA-3-methyladenine glycosylase II
MPSPSLPRSADARLDIRAPFAGRRLLAWLAARAIPGVEDVGEAVYRRTTPAGFVRLELRARHVVVTAAPGAGLADAVDGARRLLDLDADARRIDAALSADAALAPLVAARPGLRVPGCWDPFELTIRAVLGQQVSVAGASRLAGRLVEAYGEPLAEPDGALTHRFPPPGTLADADIAFVPAARARALRAVAAAFADGAVDVTDQQALQRLPGVGPWTAAYVAMRAGRDPDAFPATDLVLRRALAAAPCDPDRWRPYRAYAAMQLWAAAPGALTAAAPPRRRG